VLEKEVNCGSIFTNTNQSKGALMSRHLTREQRCPIKTFLDTSHPQTEIAQTLSVHKSTLQRELKRNCGVAATTPSKPMPKRWPDEQESHTRRSCWMRRQISSKSDTCTESMDVYAAGISVKVGAHYPGRSADLPCATGIERCRDGLAEVSRRHSRLTRPSRRPEHDLQTGA